ncbi:dihydrodipicolinate synthase family protein [Devosia rhodophyticola]|uniref:Dihydrodipicolinate synthase family protein n=1 Tax=Devosia rhodophyticola TaxID=3026423 RepID=A0ABY7YXV0_9HYPH|nr:dihydrodipicolinate synthase family protein [Devosia rhodophyticola]WDR06213.1 dihydrodipicolinate synthase family protein [Devosia rhodophyticola]
MPAFKLSDITGVIPALITPFDENEAFDEKRMRACVRFLLARKVDGFYLTGSTGETFLMSPEERKRVVEVVVDEVAGRVPVMAHIGAIGTHLSIDLAQHAQKTGVDALSSVPPFYWSFPQHEVLGYYADLTASTDLPMIVYNVPLAGLFGFDMIAKLAQIKGVEGIKYTAPTQFEIMRIKAEISKEFVVYSGADEMAMSGLSFGADGIIGSLYNLMPELFIGIRDAIATKDLGKAQALQETANAIIFFGASRGLMAVIKRGMAWQGADAGYCRRPFSNYYDPEAEEALKNEFRLLKKERNLVGVKFLDAI